MQVEDVARVGLASRRPAQKQRQGAIGDRVLGQVVVDDEDVLALVHEVLGHGAGGVGRQVLEGGRTGRGGDDDRVVQGAVALRVSTTWAVVEAFCPMAA